MNDRINYFKGELKNYVYYKNALIQVELKLRMIAKDIEGISSPNLTDPIIENKTYQSPINKFQYIYEEEKYIERRKQLQSIVNLIDKFLSQLEDNIKSVVIGIYILNTKTYENCSEEINYSGRALKNKINKEIETFLKNHDHF